MTSLPPVTPLVSRRRLSGVWLAVGSIAAVLLAVVVGAGVLRTAGGGTDATQTLAVGSPEAGEKQSPAPPYAVDRSTDASGLAVSAGGDLGAVDDATSLAAKAGPGLARDAQVAAAAPGRAAASASTASATGGATTADAPPASAAVGTRPCETQVRDARPDLRQVVYFATATSGGRPAFVLGFATDPGPVRLLAVSQEGCAIFVETALP